MMSPSEKEAILQFMGQTYGQSHKMDKDIVGQSQYLKPSSGAIRNQFEEVLRVPIDQLPQPQYQPSIPQYQPPVAPPPITTIGEVPVEQAIQELRAYNDPQVSYITATPQLSQAVNSDVIEVLREISLNLSRIANILENKKPENVRTKKVKSTVPE